MDSSTPTCSWCLVTTATWFCGQINCVKKTFFAQDKRICRFTFTVSPFPTWETTTCLHFYYTHVASCSFLSRLHCSDCGRAAEKSFTLLLLFLHFRPIEHTHKGLGSSSAIKINTFPCRKWRYKSIPLVFMLRGSRFTLSCLCAFWEAPGLRWGRAMARLIACRHATVDVN